MRRKGRPPVLHSCCCCCRCSHFRSSAPIRRSADAAANLHLDPHPPSTHLMTVSSGCQMRSTCTWAALSSRRAWKRRLQKMMR